ncbi:MAG TPA: AarF/UbiB family protein, partial [Solirubrobacteraceae bacterium]|nr:AarF/UbiB family protein [Solirubrobacteraceae bacterium]
GQVHEARLRDGREVAVKIQYPGVADAIRADLKNAELLAAFVSLVFGGLSPRKLSFDLRGVARELSVRIAEELDYRLEAAYQAEFAEHYCGHPFIHVPEVVAELCTGRVLTQQLARGLCWSDALDAGQKLRDQWAEAIHRFAYGSYKRIYLFNADPHPGNYLFHEDGSVSFLDFGCVKRFRREQVEMMDTIGPSANALRHNTVSPDYTVMAVGVASVIAQLRAGNRWGVIAAEHLENAQPLTEMGKRERAFFEECQVAGNA